MPYEAGDRHYINLRDVVASVMYQLKDFLAPDGVVKFSFPFGCNQFARKCDNGTPLECVVRPNIVGYDGDNEATAKRIEFSVSKKDADKFLNGKAKDVLDWSNFN